MLLRLNFLILFCYICVICDTIQPTFIVTKSDPWEKWSILFFLPLIYCNNVVLFYFWDKQHGIAMWFFSHPTCSGSGCSVSIAFETTYVLLHSLLNPTIESGPPSSSGDCWARLSTAVPHPRLHSLCLLGRHSERPKYVRTVVCRFWRNFATKLLSRGSTLHAETKSRTPEKIKSQKNSILFFMTPIYYNNQFIFLILETKKQNWVFLRFYFLNWLFWDLRSGIETRSIWAGARPPGQPRVITATHCLYHLLIWEGNDRMRIRPPEKILAWEGARASSLEASDAGTISRGS